MAKQAGLKVEVIGNLAALRDFQPEWERLYDAVNSRNPFAHPRWLTSWAEHFVNSSDLRVMVVRDGSTLDGGALLGVAPFYLCRTKLLGRTLLTHIELLGAGRSAALTELPQVLATPTQSRAVLREVVRALYTLDEPWAWAQITLSPATGWFEPQWLPDDKPPSSSFVVHKGSRACVVLPLETSWEAQRAGFKRNLKESLRRGVNRLTREGLDWSIDKVSVPGALPDALNLLIDLHSARSKVEHTVNHSDALAVGCDRAMLESGVVALAKIGGSVCYLLRVGERVVAGLLVFTVDGCTYMSFSGMAADYWSYGAVTTLQGEAVKDAVDRGDKVVNLSAGPNVAKLRWSEEIELYQDFLIVGPARRSALTFSLFWQISSAMKLGRERKYQA